METAGEERVRAGRSLRKLEDIAVLLDEGARANPPTNISPDFPKSISEILNELTTLSSREDAERLLAAGVSMWNSVIALEGPEVSPESLEAHVKVRHCAVDCIYMASTCLGGISSQFDVQESTLLKFYTACGKKYASDLGDMEMAAVCFAKANEFGKSAKALASQSPDSSCALSRAMFDLLLGSAECAWDRNEREVAEGLLAEAAEYLEELPGECEYMASVLFNLGLFSYRAKEPERALTWLHLSLDTRAMECNKEMNERKQAKTARLCGVCYLANKDFEKALKMMEQAESICQDPVGAYLLLKLSVLTREKDIRDRLFGILDDSTATLDICMASIALLMDAQRTGEAISGFDKLFSRYATEPDSLVRVIGPRYFEALSSLGRVRDAISVMNACCEAISAIGEGEDSKASVAMEIDKWTALMLYSGSALAERKEFKAAACMLDKCLSVFDQSRTLLENELVQTEAQSERPGSVVLKNEASVYRLAASCALCAATEKKTSEGDGEAAGCNDKEGDQSISTLLDQAMKYAQLAKKLDKDDFAPRLLIFRVYLLRGKSLQAATEMRQASEEIRTFDAGALAEAACEAKDAGSFDSVLAVLTCILRNSACSEKASDIPGFIGTVLVSAVNIVIRKSQTAEDERTGKGGEREHQGCIDAFPHSKDEAVEILRLLQDGSASIFRAGLEVAFDEKISSETSLTYLADIAWNVGRRAGLEKWYELWEGLFEICHDLSLLRKKSLPVLQTRRVARLMSATAIIERSSTESTPDMYVRAAEKLADVRSLTTEVHSITDGDDSTGMDPIIPLLVVLEGRCCAGRQDHHGLSLIIDANTEVAKKQPAILEQLASLAFDMIPTEDTSNEVRTLRLNNVVLGLTGALDARLAAENPDMKACSTLLRELLGVELSRLSAGNRAYSLLQRALGLIAEHQDSYPDNERRWIMATAWDTAQMFCKTGKPLEARQWAEAAKQCSAGNARLSSYIPRIQAFLTGLST